MITAQLNAPARRGGRDAYFHLPGVGAKVQVLITDPIPVLDPSDAIAALGAGCGLNTVLRGVTRGGNPGGFVRRSNRPQPSHVKQIFGVAGGVRFSVGPRQDIVQLGRFDQPFPIEIHGAGVVFPPAIGEPIASDDVGVRIKVAEESVGQRHPPDTVLNRGPAFHDFRAFDFDRSAPRRLIDDAPLIRHAAARGIDPLAINSGMHRNHIAGLGEIGGPLYGA